MHSHHEKELEKYRKEQSKGSVQFMLAGLGLMVAFVPVALIAVGAMEAVKKIRGVIKR